MSIARPPEGARHPSAQREAVQRPLRPAASVLLVRPGSAGIEVLMLHRADKGDHFSGAWVFPGGIVDAADRAQHACCAGLDDAAASGRLGVPECGLDYHVAAIRETFEEAGVLLCLDAQGNFPATDDPLTGTLLQRRHAIAAGAVDFGAECSAQGLRLAADRLHYIAHWITPLGMAKRFDTRFFLAVLPPDQSVSHDGGELTDHAWFRPADLLASKDHKLLAVQRSLLDTVDRFGSLDALLAWAASAPPVRSVLRRRCRDATGPTGVMPEHPAWPEIGLLDPTGAGEAWCELPAGQVTALAPGVLRRAGPGGNAYLVGDAASGWAAIDAHGDDAAAWLAAAGASDATLLGTRELRGPERLVLGGWVLERLEAPAGAAAWLLATQRLAFTGRWEPSCGEIPGADWAAPAAGFLLPLTGDRLASGQ